MKRLFAPLLIVVMVLSLVACGGTTDNGSSSERKFDSNKGISTDLGCELSDYLFIDSKDKLGKFIEENELQYFFMPGSVDVYSGDYVNFAALPLGYGSYDNTDGGTTKCVFLAITSMDTYEDAPYQE